MSAGKKRWAHRTPKKQGKKGKESQFKANQQERRDRVNRSIQARQAEIERLAAS